MRHTEPGVEDQSTEPQSGLIPSVTTLNINTASAVELELLPDIGPALSKRIVEYREEHGAFKTIDGLRNVKGIGPKTLTKIRQYLTTQ